MFIAFAKHVRAILLTTAALIWAPAAEGQSPAPQKPQQKAAATGRQTPAKPGTPTPKTPSKGEEKRARKAYDLGLKAESAGDRQAAYEAYTEATALNPANKEYLLQRELARFRLVQLHVDAGEQAAIAGRMDLARNELRAAVALDPGYSVSQERLAQFEARAQRAPRVLVSSPRDDIQLKPRPGRRSFNYRGNTRGAYEEIARQFGLSASFDEGLRPSQVRFRVADLDFDQAMHVLSRQTHTFWRVIDEKEFFVADDTPQKRREYGPSVIRTVLLAGSTSPEQMTETLRLVREIAGISRTQLDTRTRTLTIRGDPDDVALAVELINEFEQSRGEMMLEVNILEVNSSKARQLGILPPSSAQIFAISPQDLTALQAAQGSPGELAQLLQRIFGTTGTPQTGAFGLGLVPPLVAFGGGKTVALATLPGASASFSETFSVLRNARRMLLRSEDGKPASFFVGERFPVNLAVLSQNAGLALPGGAAATLPQGNVAVGDGPVAVVTFDFNADGVLDLATVNQTSNDVSILLGSSNGPFGAAMNFAVGAAPSGMAVGDFNGDGKLDLAVTNQTDNNASILLGNGDGTFGAPTNFATGAGPSAILALNLDTNAQLDLVVANQTDNDISVLLGNGDGTFGPPANFPTGLSPVALVSGDFNGDARLDVAVANNVSNSVSVLVGNGDGTFGTTLDFPTGGGSRAVTVGMFDSGTVPDLVVANETDDTFSLLLGNGDGTFGTATNFNVGDGPAALAAADFDGNGNLDLAIANRNAKTISIIFGRGDGTFSLRADFSAGDGPSALVLGNFNTDGRVDLAVANRDSDDVTVILNSPLFATPPSSLIPPVAYPNFQYEDLGLKVRATPRLHTNNEVTLQLAFEIRSRSGADFNGIPVISNRTVEQTVRLRENETTVLAGLLQREERPGATGWPPVVSRKSADHRETELVILVTPRRLRLAPRANRSIYAGRESSGGSAVPQQRP